MTANNPETPTIFCPYCGRRNPEDARFCIGCGREIPNYSYHQQGTTSTGSASVVNQSGSNQYSWPSISPAPPASISPPPPAPLVAPVSTSAPAPAPAPVPYTPQPNPTGVQSHGYAPAAWNQPQQAYTGNVPGPTGYWNAPPFYLQPPINGPIGRPVCRFCNVESTQLGLLSFDQSIWLCGNCKKYVRAALMNEYQRLCPLSVISPEAMQSFEQYAMAMGLDPGIAFSLIRKDGLAALKSTVENAVDALGIVFNNRDYENLPFTLKMLGGNLMENRAITRQAESVRYLMPLRQGNLPAYRIEYIYLESDEVCHLAVSATFRKLTSKAEIKIPGEFIATSKRMLFRGSEGTIEIPWKNVLGVNRGKKGITLELSAKRGDGYYWVKDPLYVSNVLSILALAWKRQIVFDRASSASRRIPQDVKTAVWQRDGGACVQCGATDYLEFDHIIPHSKGGANTINNVQLLCRKCNGIKSDRI